MLWPASLTPERCRLTNSLHQHISHSRWGAASQCQAGQLVHRPGVRLQFSGPEAAFGPARCATQGCFTKPPTSDVTRPLSPITVPLPLPLLTLSGKVEKKRLSLFAMSPV